MIYPPETVVAVTKRLSVKSLDKFVFMVKCAPVHPHQYPICILLELTSPYYHDYN